MKKIIVVLALALAFGLPQMAAADTITTLSSWGPYKSSGGGEFTVMPGDGLVISPYYSANTTNIVQIGTFQTFCLELNEYIDLNATYNAVVSYQADNGGVGGGHPDPLSVGSAYLYSKFATGTLGSYDYATTPGRTTDAGLLQNAFWMLEDELAISDTRYDLTNKYIVLVGSVFSTFAGAQDDYAGGPVKVLNLTTRTDGHAQDLLVLVPEPTTVLLLGLGMIGLAGIRRRMTR